MATDVLGRTDLLGSSVRLYRRTHLDLMRSVSAACRRG
jgi:hypothetical protein